MQWIPENVFANNSSQLPDYDFKINSEGDSYHFELFKFEGSGRRVSFYYNNTNDLTTNFTTAIISTVPISDSATRYKYSLKTDGVFELDKKSDETQHSFTFTYNSTKYYVTYYGMAVYYSPGDRSVYSGKLGAFYLSSQAFDSVSESEALISDYIAGHVPYTCTLVCDGGEDGELSTDVGSVNNPIEDDKEIGIPIITKRRYTTVYHDTDMGNASDGKEDIDDSQFIFDWSNKTSTGFNLKKNKYHMTRIQIKVQSKCVVYSGFSHKTVKKRFDNYGEMSSEIKSALVDDTPYSIEYGTVKSMLPKTFSEKHNPLYVGRNFTFYFRVMCNESASGTGKWHCGAWRAVGLNASTTQDQTDESSNGHIDSDGNYTKDPDDGHNNSDSDSSTVDDKEDAKDQFKDDQKNDVTNGKNDSSGFEWSDLKKLVNECKEVPGLIKSIFSFLPDWVLVFVAVGFGIWIFVLIKRAIV
jgi:hypothetical protein